MNLRFFLSLYRFKRYVHVQAFFSARQIVRNFKNKPSTTSSYQFSSSYFITSNDPPNVSRTYKDNNFFIYYHFEKKGTKFYPRNPLEISRRRIQRRSNQFSNFFQKGRRKEGGGIKTITPHFRFIFSTKNSSVLNRNDPRLIT